MSGAEPSGPAAITLEDLDGVAEESADSAYHSHGSSLEEEGAERMDDEEQERLLNYWQSVGRGHQVDVPRGKPAERGAGGAGGSPVVRLPSCGASTRFRSLEPMGADGLG